ncbi:MAG: hypothetical protein A3J66_02605 [Candidatus Magasanikbacteria bacterium RIFCSPHIGHO2_02_FULL_47_14]|uniref:Type II secretion system protein GspF domain-containing protein n=1 Tax=Candidatus Magasanikbacteria bacterium RIFCSPHIGHO2_02_FULL_47_14 TaxID=1798680 RepID=A0A1F6MAY2_9BACT|nr:MAG: hypothetical protein A3J66_02605 [Candidatus Magasanikbacteria bacterium RIFCSPHIGHO2_02_FULL_47_14]
MTSNKPKSQTKAHLGIIGGVPFTEKVGFAKYLSVMLRSGLTVREALTVIEESSRGNMRRIVSDIVKVVDGGETLAAALSRHPKIFSPLFINIVKAGEESGTLSENLQYLAYQLDREKQLRTRVRSSLFYPGLILSATLVLGLSLAYFVLPQLVPMFVGLRIELPWTTRLVMRFALLMQQHGGLVVASVFGSIIFLSWFLRRRLVHPVTHFIILHIPILSRLVRSNNLARCGLTLGTLLKSGIPITEAFRITRDTIGNFYYRRALRKVMERVESGYSLSVELAQYDKRLFPRFVTSMVSVGEASGRLDETLLYIAEFYDAEVDSTTKTMSTLIEPVLLLGIGIFVGILALAIITPIYEITGNVR